MQQQVKDEELTGSSNCEWCPLPLHFPPSIPVSLWWVSSFIHRHNVTVGWRTCSRTKWIPGHELCALLDLHIFKFFSQISCGRLLISTTEIWIFLFSPCSYISGDRLSSTGPWTVDLILDKIRVQLPCSLRNCLFNVASVAWRLQINFNQSLWKADVPWGFLSLFKLVL